MFDKKKAPFPKRLFLVGKGKPSNHDATVDQWTQAASGAPASSRSTLNSGPSIFPQTAGRFSRGLARLTGVRSSSTSVCNDLNTWPGNRISVCSAGPAAQALGDAEPAVARNKWVDYELTSPWRKDYPEEPASTISRSGSVNTFDKRRVDATLMRARRLSTEMAEIPGTSSTLPPKMQFMPADHQWNHPSIQASRPAKIEEEIKPPQAEHVDVNSSAPPVKPEFKLELPQPKVEHADVNSRAPPVKLESAPPFKLAFESAPAGKLELPRPMVEDTDVNSSAPLVKLEPEINQPKISASFTVSSSVTAVDNSFETTVNTLQKDTLQEAFWENGDPGNQITVGPSDSPGSKNAAEPFDGPRRVALGLLCVASVLIAVYLFSFFVTLPPPPPPPPSPRLLPLHESLLVIMPHWFATAFSTTLNAMQQWLASACDGLLDVLSRVEGDAKKVAAAVLNGGH